MTEDSAQANSAPTPEPAATASPKRVVLWGAGLANLRFLAAFAKHPTPHTLITLVTPYATVINPRRLADWVAGALPLEACSTDVAQAVARSGVQWIQNNVVALDADARTCSLTMGKPSHLTSCQSMRAPSPTATRSNWRCPACGNTPCLLRP